MANRMPWERQEGESTVAFEAFMLYRDLGHGRSGREVGEKLAKSGTLMKRWSAQWDWIERAGLYDDEKDRETMAILRKGRAEMARQDVILAKALKSKVALWIKGVDAADVKKWRPGEAARALEVASKLERITRGEPTERTEIDARIETRQTVDLGQLDLPLSVRQAILDAIEKADQGGKNGGSEGT